MSGTQMGLAPITSTCCPPASCVLIRSKYSEAEAFPAGTIVSSLMLGFWAWNVLAISLYCSRCSGWALHRCQARVPVSGLIAPPAAPPPAPPALPPAPQAATRAPPPSAAPAARIVRLVECVIVSLLHPAPSTGQA